MLEGDLTRPREAWARLLDEDFGGRKIANRLGGSPNSECGQSSFPSDLPKDRELGGAVSTRVLEGIEAWMSANAVARVGDIRALLEE